MSNNNDEKNSSIDNSSYNFKKNREFFSNINNNENQTTKQRPKIKSKPNEKELTVEKQQRIKPKQTPNEKEPTVNQTEIKQKSISESKVETNKDNNEDNEIDFSIIDKKIKNIKNCKGKMNIVIAGKTGVGRSTLINSIFHQDLAKEGIGKPITQEIEEITKKDFPISIYDTKGLEIDDYQQIIDDLERFIIEKRNKTTINEQLHVAWLCFPYMDFGVEEAELKLNEMFYKNKIPVIIVITKCFPDEEYLKSYIDVIKKNLSYCKMLNSCSCKTIYNCFFKN